MPTQTYSIRVVAGHRPLSPATAAADAARGLVVAGPIVEPVLRTFAWSVVLLPVFIPVSVARFRRTE